MRDPVLLSEDQLLLIVVMTLAYGVGFAAVRWTVGLLVPNGDAPRGARFALAGLPLLACVAAEWITGLWDSRPGALGLGPLHVALPMLAAGAVAAAALLLLRPVAPRAGAARVVWGLAAVGLAGVALALWRLWPAPTPRLF